MYRSNQLLRNEGSSSSNTPPQQNNALRAESLYSADQTLSLPTNDNNNVYTSSISSSSSSSVVFNIDPTTNYQADLQHRTSMGPYSMTNLYQPNIERRRSSLPNHGLVGNSSRTLHKTVSQNHLRGTLSRFQCPNCIKSFQKGEDATDMTDTEFKLTPSSLLLRIEKLLKRHLAREALALAKPSVDRQKSCFECAKSKSRCDLDVPTCERCQLRGLKCVYGARSGNPNILRNQLKTREPSSDDPSRSHKSPSRATDAEGSNPGTYRQGSGDIRQSLEEARISDDQIWVDSSQSPLNDQELSTSYTSARPSFDLYQPTYDINHPQAFQSSQSQGQTSERAASTGSDLLTGHRDSTDDYQTDVNAVNHPYASSSADTIYPYKQAQTDDAQRRQSLNLLTGSKMPSLASTDEIESVTARPLFSAHIDWSSWLEEQVIPSPLSRPVPTLSALAPPTPNRYNYPLSLYPWTNNSSGNIEGARNILPSSYLPPPLSNTAMGARPQEEKKTSYPKPLVAVRQWWTNATLDPLQKQEVAEASASHFTLYPAMMILPESTSPVPPLFHRPWLASLVLDKPSSLARVRVLLAAYYVKLPSSEGMVWDMIANEANALTCSLDQHSNVSDVEVFSSTAALWFLVILLLMSNDQSTNSGSITESFLHSTLIGLSNFAKLLSQRYIACKNRKRTQGFPRCFLDWGFEETMKRTLFAIYTLLVLQRFRQTSSSIYNHQELVGIDLIQDIPLPAPATEFEAEQQFSWQAFQHVGSSDSVESLDYITIKDLFKFRKGEDIPTQKAKDINTYFDQHDNFTNICLSVAFALDQHV